MKERVSADIMFEYANSASFLSTIVMLTKMLISSFLVLQVLFGSTTAKKVKQMMLFDYRNPF